MERLMFADLCRFAPGELDTFGLVCAALGLAVAVTTHLAEARFAPTRGSRASRAFIVALALIPFSWIATTLVFPDPRKNGDICGFTPDAIFLPMFATIMVFFCFIGGRGLMLGLDRYRAARK